VEQVAVPNFVGQTLDDARVTADPLGLELAPSAQESDRPIGTILSQDPAPDTKVDKGAQVKVVVATGTQTVAVPDLRLKTEADAVAAIIGAGLTNGTRGVAFDPVAPAGTVVRQDPQAGVRVARGTPVNYVVSNGPEPTPIPTPSPTPTLEPTPTPVLTPTPLPSVAPLTVGDYRCLTLDGAGQQMAADGFTLGTVATSPTGGAFDGSWLVQAQVPTPGETRPPGTAIRVTVIDPASACP
jgi:serine/threonine-protein kinase